MSCYWKTQNKTNACCFRLKAASAQPVTEARELREVFRSQKQQYPCGLQLQFLFPIPSPASFVERVDEQLHLIWGEERSITQVISYEYNKEPLFYSNTATVLFQKTITEEHAEDLSAVVDHMVETIERLQELLTNLN